MENTLVDSIDKLYQNRLIETDEAFEEFLDSLDKIGIYISTKKEIDNIAEYIKSIVKVFDNDNIDFDCIESVKYLIFYLVEYNYIDNKTLFSELLDNLPHLTSVAPDWGGEILTSIFYDLEVENTLSLEEISKICNAKDIAIRKIFKEFIEEITFEHRPSEIKSFADKCLTVLS